MTGGWNDDCDQMRERTAGSAAEKTAQGANAHSENTDHQRTLHITPHVILTRTRMPLRRVARNGVDSLATRNHVSAAL